MQRELNWTIKKRLTYKLLQPIVICLFFAFATVGYSLAQDSTRVEFRFELRYQGASVTINQNYRYIMEYLVETLENDTTLRIHIRGHVCCGPGVKISMKRARNVYRFLKRNGISEHRMTYKGYSNEIPKAIPEKTEEDEAKNRRVDFILYRKTN